jgi:UDP-glucuronate decarboxylase
MTAAKANGKQRPDETPADDVSDGELPVLVCGGAGFIGAHLCGRLLREGKRVICLDNFCTSEEAGIEHLLPEPRFELIRGHVARLDPAHFEPVSAIFNLACAASPRHYQAEPLDTLFASVNGVNQLLQLARRCNVRMFQASTSEIYGHPEVHPQPERYWGYVNTMGPRACYDEGKRCAETLCYIYHQEYDVPVRVGRIFNTYGPGMHVSDGRVVINFIVQALAGEPLTVYGDGMQTRSFCYVDDLVEAILRIMDERNTFMGPINIGNPTEITVRELAQRILRLTGSRSRIVARPLPQDDPPRRRPDIAVAQRVLDWQPTTDLDTGLGRTIEDVERRLYAADATLIDAVGFARAAMASRREGVTRTAL